jgi:mRNA interferase HigB
MIVLGADRLVDFGGRHADAAPALTAWRMTVLAAAWQTPVDVKRTYRSVDPAVAVRSGGKVAVFNIKGNKYRLIAAIDYSAGIVNVLRVMTHSDYSRDRWKDVL